MTTCRLSSSRPSADSTKSNASLARRIDDITVVVTAYIGTFPEQRQLVRSLHENGRTIVVLARSPYDASWFRFAGVLVATYGSAPASMRALARIMNGEMAPSGKLPVRIPGPPYALFPFGHGVTWDTP